MTTLRKGAQSTTYARRNVPGDGAIPKRFAHLLLRNSNRGTEERPAWLFPRGVVVATVRAEMRISVCLLAAGFFACSNTKTATKTDAPNGVPSASVATTASATPSDEAGVVAVVDAGPDAALPPLAGANVLAQTLEIYRVAACGGAASTAGVDPAPTPAPSAFDAAMVNEHCTALAQLYVDYKKNWMDVAMPFIAKLVPPNSPKAVVYPFGGGDLMGAIATYPDANEYTTISLEIAADVRKIDGAPKTALKSELGRYNTVLGKYFDKAHSRTDNLDIGTKSVLPGEVVFDLVALVLHGYEPLAVRYFTFDADGLPKYVTDEQISKADQAVKDKKKRSDEVDNELFKNMEIIFRKKGDLMAPIKTARHVAMNLDDTHMKADPRLAKHLEQKTQIAAMTKAGSHLLWSDDFSIIRDYMAKHTDFMISDTTGFPPAYAKKMGFVQDTYGTYTWPLPFGAVDPKIATDVKKVFDTNTHVDISFRYGYPDKDSHGSIMVNRKPTVPAPKL